MKSLRIIAVIGFVALAMTNVGCSDRSEPDDDRLTVAVAFYPIEELARRVGGSNIEVTTLVSPGSEAHEFEPTARQVANLEDADVVFYLGSGFQPSLQNAISALPGSVRAVDLLDGLTVLTGDDGTDPHVWLDPHNMQSMAQRVADVLSEESPAQAIAFTNGSDAYIGDLAELDDAFDVGLAECAVPVAITTHRAFDYLANAYQLTHRAIAGVSPGDEPSARSLEEIAEFAAASGVTTIFYEAELSELAQTVADEIGVDTARLETVESLTENQLDDGESYLSVMRHNLEALRAGLQCK